MKRCLVWLAAFYSLGIFLAGFMILGFWPVLLTAAAVLVTANLLIRKNNLFLPLALLLALLCGYLNLKNACSLARCHLIKLVAYKDSLFCRLDGFIASSVEFKQGYYWFIFCARQIQLDNMKYQCRGKVLVKIYSGQGLNYGDNVMLTGNLNRLASSNRTKPSYQDFLARQDIYFTMRIEEPRQITRKPGFSGIRLIKDCFRLRAYLEGIIYRHLPALPASILAAMVLGQKQNLPWLVNNSMVKSGTVHILVVSGFNVGIVALVVNLLLKILRFARKARIVLVGFCLLIYCFVTGATNPVIRATVMGLVFLSAYFLKREPDIYNSLACAALLILAINPRQLLDIGFQLSFLSVLAIVYFYPKLNAVTRLDSCRSKVLKFIAQGCWVSFSAWLGTFLIIAANFRMIVPVTVLANILIVPLATLITLCGFTLVFFGGFFPGLAYLLSLPTALLINLLLSLNAALIRLPLAYFYF